MFDCTFTNPPIGAPPVQGLLGAVLVSNCTSPGSDRVVDSKTAIDIPPGRRGAAGSSARQTFFRSEVEVPARCSMLERDFGAKGDGKADDTQALRATVKAARKHGKRAIAYLPCGQYRVYQDDRHVGEDYVVGGAGAGLAMRHAGAVGRQRARSRGGVAVFHVSNARNVPLEDLGDDALRLF